MSHLYYANKEIQFLFESDDLSEIDYLLKNGLDINSCDVFNNNALFIADFEKTKFLVDRGINIFQKSYYDRTAVISSYRKKQDIKKVKYLITKGLIPNKDHPYLLHGNSIEVLEFFIQKYNFNVTDINKDGYNTLFFTNRESAEFMISKGVDPFYKAPKYDLTTLYWNELETLELLISKGVDPFYINKGNENQLYGVRNLSCLKYLLNLGLDPYHKADSYTNLLFSGLSSDSLDFLVNNYNYDINEVGSDGKNLLFTAESIESMDYLIKKGLNPFVLFDNKTLIEYMPIECIPYLLNMGVHKTQNNKLCFSNEIDARVKCLIINKNIEDNNVNILNKENGNNLLFENIDDVELSCKLINSDINLHYINDRMAGSSKSHFLSCVNDYEVYDTAKNKGLFSNEYYNNFLKNTDIASLKIKDINIFNDILESDIINISNILFSDYPNYKTRYIINNKNIDINKVKNESTALLESKSLKKTISLIKNGANINYISKTKNSFEHEDNDNYFCYHTIPNNIFEHLLILYNHKKYDIFNMLKFLKQYGLNLNTISINSTNQEQNYSNCFLKLISNSNNIEDCISLFQNEIKYLDLSQIHFYDDLLLLNIIKNDNIFKSLSDKNFFSLYDSGLYLYYKGNNREELLIQFINKTHLYIINNKNVFINDIKNNFFYFNSSFIYNLHYIQPDSFFTKIIKDIQFIVFDNEPDIIYSDEYINNIIIDDEFIRKGFNIYATYSNNENILFKNNNLVSIKKCIKMGVDTQLINYEGFDFVSKRIFEHLLRQFPVEDLSFYLNLIKLKPDFQQNNYYGENCMDELKNNKIEYFEIINNLLNEIELKKEFIDVVENNNKKSRRL